MACGIMAWKQGLVVFLVCACMVALAGCAGGARSHRASADSVPDAVTLSQARERAIALLDEMAMHPDPQVRGNALEGLLEAPGRSQLALERALEDPSPGVRAIALMGIGRARRGELVGKAFGLRDDPSPFVRVSAAYALAANGDTSAMGEIARALLDSDDPRLRAHAAMILGIMGNRTAMPLLREAIAKPMPMAPVGQVRLMTLQMSEAMVKLGDTDQIQPIRAALYPARAEDLEATAMAAGILGEVGDHGSIEQLVLLTARLDQQGKPMPAEVRLSAAFALAKLGRRQGDFIAQAYLDDPFGSVRGQAAILLGEIGKTNYLADLEGLLGDPDPRVRVHAAAAIVRLTRP